MKAERGLGGNEDEEPPPRAKDAKKTHAWMKKSFFELQESDLLKRLDIR